VLVARLGFSVHGAIEIRVISWITLFDVVDDVVCRLREASLVGAARPGKLCPCVPHYYANAAHLEASKKARLITKIIFNTYMLNGSNEPALRQNTPSLPVQNTPSLPDFEHAQPYRQ